MNIELPQYRLSSAVAEIPNHTDDQVAVLKSISENINRMIHNGFDDGLRPIEVAIKVVNSNIRVRMSAVDVNTPVELLKNFAK